MKTKTICEMDPYVSSYISLKKIESPNENGWKALSCY